MNNGEFFLADAIEVIEEILNAGGEFRMYPKGTSMLPLIVQGRDSVVLTRCSTPRIIDTSPTFSPTLRLAHARSKISSTGLPQAVFRFP